MNIKFMKNTISVFIGADEFICTEFFYDIDIIFYGIEIKNAYTNEYIGSIFDISIPDPDADDEDFVRFNSIVEDWLTDNYYN